MKPLLKQAASSAVRVKPGVNIVLGKGLQRARAATDNRHPALRGDDDQTTALNLPKALVTTLESIYKEIGRTIEEIQDQDSSRDSFVDADDLQELGSDLYGLTLDSFTLFLVSEGLVGSGKPQLVEQNAKKLMASALTRAKKLIAQGKAGVKAKKK